MDWLKKLHKEIEQKGESAFQKKYGNIKGLTTNLAKQLGRQDYEKLKDLIYYNIDSWNVDGSIRLAKKLGMNKLAKEIFNEYQY